MSVPAAPGRRRAHRIPSRAAAGPAAGVLLTEAQIAAAAGLPGPVIAELFSPLFPASAATAVYFDEDVIKAQIAAMMLQAGIRWRWVQNTIAGLPDDPTELGRLHDFWRRRTPPPHGAASAALSVLGVVCALIAGLLLGAAGVRP